MKSVLATTRQRHQANDLAELKAAEKERDLIKIEREDEIRDYYELRQLLKEKGQDFQAVISHPTYALPFLNPGRLVEVKDGDVEFGWGIVVAYNKIINPKVSRNETEKRGSRANE